MWDRWSWGNYVEAISLDLPLAICSGAVNISIAKESQDGSWRWNLGQ
jgi:hypothetical protein